jgi:hypothetical protein
MKQFGDAISARKCLFARLAMLVANQPRKQTPDALGFYRYARFSALSQFAGSCAETYLLGTPASEANLCKQG